jgi:hypothetical protein
MAEPDVAGADRFLQETVRLAVALDAITAWDLPDNVAQALRSGYSRFGELLIRRGAVPINPEEDVLIGWVLEVVAARLRFLQGVHHNNLPN